MEATAPAYDLFTDHHDYETWTAAIEALARQHGLARRGRLLDVGCGTGKSFLPWLARGWSVTGCDFSAAMLEQAAAKAPSARLIEADARSLGDIGRFDLVLLLDDVVNLVPTTDLVTVFGEARRNLAPDGLVVFDLNTLRTFRTFFTAVEVRERDGCVVSWTGKGCSDLGPGAVAEAVMETFVRDDVDGTWQRSRGTHREYHHPLPVAEQALTRAGLELAAVRGHDEQCRFDPEPDELAHSKLLVVARQPATRT